jgi:DNA mismatch repair protein MutS
MIYDDYIDYTSKYQSQYGDKTLVLLQVGDFFEIYGVQNDTENVGADMYTIGDMCNLTITRKNKTILENNRSNPLMAGFPLYAVSKHIQTLVSNGYTVVVIRQVTPPPNVTRAVTEIISPSMNIQPSSQDSNFLLVYYWDHACSPFLSVGISGVDVSTGKTFCYEVGSTASDPAYALDEAFRILQCYQPKEVVILSSNKLDEGSKTTIANVLDFPCSRVVHKKWNDFPKEYNKVVFQNEMIAKIYKDECMIQPLETVGLERMDNSRLAFVFMLQFVFDHNDLIVQRLTKPSIIETSKYMTLEYNSAVQLNVLSTLPNEKPLIQILNRCCTAFGSRLFRDYLLQPSTSVDVLTAKYERVEQLINNHNLLAIRRSLKQVCDLERLRRKFQLGTLHPLEWVSFHSSLLHALNVCSFDQNDVIESQIHTLINHYKDVLDLDECGKYLIHDIKGNVFHPHIHPYLDEWTNSISDALKFIESISNGITRLDPSCICKVDCNDRDGYFLQMTKKRWETILGKGGETKVTKDIRLKDFTAKPLSHGSSTVRIQHKSIETASDSIISLQRKICGEATLKYKQYVEDFYLEHEKTLETVIGYLANLDVSCNNAINAIEYGYCKPTIVKRDDASSSFFDIKGIRHPIIERLNQSVEYVKNDIAMQSGDGLLLYGINASGKSSLMKAIGLNIIMAQAGMYVAGTSMCFKPFHHIFTRISSMDNIYRGMSTFTVEMAELRNILQRCDERSLVLGDELCAGTESTSATAIVAAGIKTLIEKRAPFVFATHLHELVDIPIVAEIPRLRICHMHIEIDENTNKIVYDRTLKDGHGSELYGLEVCRSLAMPADFIQTAHQVRRHIQNVPENIIHNRWSRYNKNVIMNICKVCGHKATETHHINYQKDASSFGFVKDGLKVHDSANLVPLCENCHNSEHNGELKIEGYKQTSNGIELQFTYERNHTVAEPQRSGFEDIVCSLKDIIRYDGCHWYKKTTRGAWRKSSRACIERHVEKVYKQSMNPEERDALTSSFLTH